VDRDDLLQEAAIGLLRAVRYYDPSRGTLFTTLAAICVDQAVGSCVEEAWSFGMRPRNRDDAPKVVVVDPDFLMPPEEDDDLEEES
jgi:DNA-directed RNA polymerase specialized sigma24 family protein